MFPKKKVYPVPYIREVDYKPPNVPLPADEQLALLTKLDGSTNAKRVNFTYEDDPAHECGNGDNTPKCQVGCQGGYNVAVHDLRK
jgi:hypothetical protein